MSMGCRLLTLALLASCGRVGFDGAGSLCDGVVDAVYCSDFEGGELRGATSYGAVFEPHGGHDDSGGYAMAAAPGEFGQLGFELASDEDAGALHLAGRMRFEAGPPTESYVVIAELVGPLFTEKVSFDMETSDQIQLVNTAQNVQSPRSRGTAPDAFPRDRWFCFELVTTIRPNSLVEMFIDGVRVLEGWSGESTLPTGGFRYVRLGLNSSAANVEAVRARFDNWIVARAPIGCP